MRWLTIATSACFLTVVPLLFAQMTPTPGAGNPFATNALTASAQGTPRPDVTHAGTRKIQALRAAQVRAYAALLEVMQGVHISGQTTVRDVMFENEVLTARLEGMVRGAQTTRQEYDPITEVATVHVQVPVKGLGSVTETLLPTLITTPQPPDSPAYTPSAGLAPTAQPADGLIVDVRARLFRPALINRVLSVQGEILYDPSKIAQGILVEQGSGGYTTDVGKARALLSERGSRNPLTVQAVDVARTTDAQVSQTDAAAIFAANQQTSFLEGAKVVFVVK